jgi:hypothetical protein
MIRPGTGCQRPPCVPREPVGVHGRIKTGINYAQATVNGNKKNYVRFKLRRSAAPIVAIIPVSIPGSDAVAVVGATGAGVAGGTVVAVTGALVVVGIAPSLTDTDCELPRTTTLCDQSW